MTLIRKLSLIRQDTSDYLQNFKTIADELALAQAPINDEDIVISILNGFE